MAKSDSPPAQVGPSRAKDAKDAKDAMDAMDGLDGLPACLNSVPAHAPSSQARPGGHSRTRPPAKGKTTSDVHTSLLADDRHGDVTDVLDMWRRGSRARHARLARASSASARASVAVPGVCKERVRCALCKLASRRVHTTR